MAASKDWRPPESMRNELLRLGGEQCAICHRNLRKYDKVSGKVKFIADAAHIYPHSDRGERGDPARRPANVDDISNLFMLCPNCHRLVDWDGVGARLFPIGKLRALKREHEAWIAFLDSRPDRVSTDPGPSDIERGQAVSVDGQSYRLPWDVRPDRVDGTFMQEWSAELDAVRCQSYVYAETGDARHAWLRRVAARDRSETGERWRREVVDEASLLNGRLPRLPGLPSVLAIEIPPDRPVIVVTALPSSTSMLDRYGTAGTTGMAEESVRVLFAGLPTLCAALGALHDAGFAHGALDPRAILVDQRGNLVLRDLGRAGAGKAGKAERADDVQHLARVVYELVTGVPPLTGADGPPVPASLCNPAVSEQSATALSLALTGGINDARALTRRLRRAGTRKR